MRSRGPEQFGERPAHLPGGRRRLPRLSVPPTRPTTRSVSTVGLIHCKLLHPAIHHVCHVEAPLAVQRQGVRRAELTRLLALTVQAQAAQVLARICEELD